MLAIKSNTMADVAARHLGSSYDALAQSVARLSSGLRIIGAKDDAAGLAVRELIRVDVATLRQGQRNAADAISMLQVAESALGTVDNILIRMKELAEQAATGSYSADQRVLMDQEFGELAKEISRISETTDFNGIKLLAGTNSYGIHVGSTDATTANKISVQGANMDGGTLQLTGSREYGIFVTGGGVDTAASTLINVTAAGTGTLTFEFSDDVDDNTVAIGPLSIDLEAATAYSLQDIVDAVNAKSQVAQTGYTAAHIHYDSTLEKFYLKVQAYQNGDQTDLDIDGTATITEGIQTEANWTLEGGSGTGASIATQSEAETALGTVDAAVVLKDTLRAKFGYMMKRLEAAMAVVGVQAENLAVAESRISDVDVATEMSAMTRNQVLAQAGIAMLAQANTMPQMALQLLQ